jgi:hypothetical protein
LPRVDGFSENFNPVFVRINGYAHAIYNLTVNPDLALAYIIFSLSPGADSGICKKLLQPDFIFR